MKRLAPMFVLLLVAACSAETSGPFPAGAKSELRRARLNAMLHPRTPDAHIRLGRAKLAAWDDAGAEKSFVKAYRIDEKSGRSAGAAYFEEARRIASRSAIAVTDPIVGRYVDAASRWSRSTDVEAWYFERVARALPEIEPSRRLDVARYAMGRPANSLRNLRWFIGEEINRAESDRNAQRWLALADVWDATRDPSDAYERTAVAMNYARIAKLIGAEDPGATVRAIDRARELDARWNDDIDLLNLRSQLPESRASASLSNFQKTANILIQINQAANKYARERGAYPACDSIAGFVAPLTGYGDASAIGTRDAWGSELRCYVMPHGLWFKLESAGPDREFDRGEEIYATAAMQLADDAYAQADVYIEAGTYAPPWWSKEQVRALR
jgi:hypothetical protein